MSTIESDAVTAATGTNTNLALTGKGTGKVALGDGALTFPDADGSANQPIITNGSAALSFATLPVAGGGTGAVTHTANNVLVGNGTSAIASVAPSTSGNILTSNGSAWTSAAAAAGGIDNDCFFAWNASVQAIANSTYTKLEFGTEEFDTASKYDHATNYRYTPAAGKHLLAMGYFMAMNESADVFYFLYINGSAANGFSHKQICPGSGNMSSSMSMIVEADGTDYFEVFIRQNSGVSKDTNDANFSNFFCGTRLS